MLFGADMVPPALAAAAEIAMAYGALDRPDTTILFGVIFFYLVFAGPGMWSLDGRIHKPDVRPELPRNREGATARSAGSFWTCR